MPYEVSRISSLMNVKNVYGYIPNGEEEVSMHFFYDEFFFPLSEKKMQ